MLTNHIRLMTPPVDLLNQFSPEDLAIYDTPVRWPELNFISNVRRMVRGANDSKNGFTGESETAL